MIFFDIKGIGRIVLDEEVEKEEFKKLEDGKLVPLTEEERKKVEDILYPEIEYVEQLRSSTETAILKNKNLENIQDIIIACVEPIERLLPNDNRKNFIANLKTLKVVDDFKDCDFNSKAIGVYKFKNNTIYINIKQIQKDYQNNYKEMYVKTLIHELLHVASTSYNNEELDSSYCGFTKFSHELNSRNVGLTEGMTEFLTTRIMRKNRNKESYAIETRFIKQLALIVNIKPMVNSYFKGVGIKEMEQEMQKFSEFYIPRKIFGCIEANFRLNKSKECESQNVLGRAQSMMIDTFKNKINYEIENNVPEEHIKKEIQVFKSCLIDNNLLQKIKHNPNMYQGVDESIEQFQMLEDEMSRKFTKGKRV